MILAVLFTLVFISGVVVGSVKAVQFNFGCEAYLKRAANANTVELARSELEKAIDYIEKNNITEGIVSIFLKNPANDIGFWYNNIKSAYEELTNLPEESTPLEKTNVLMKLRESLTDSDENGSTTVISPGGIEIYPNNVLFFWWILGSIAALSLFWILFGVAAGANSKAKKLKETLAE